MAKMKNGWHSQSVRHSNARRFGKAGGTYSNARIKKMLRNPEYKDLTYKQLSNKGIKLKYDEDADKDGVKNGKDCRPLNRKKQGIIHSLVAGIGKGAGYVVAEVGSGFKDIPQEYLREYQEQTERERIVEEEKQKESERRISNFDKDSQRKEELLQEEEDLREAQEDLDALKEAETINKKIADMKNEDIKEESEIIEYKNLIKKLESERNELLKKANEGNIGFRKKGNKIVAVKQ